MEQKIYTVLLLRHASKILMTPDGQHLKFPSQQLTFGMAPRIIAVEWARSLTQAEIAWLGDIGISHLYRRSKNGKSARFYCWTLCISKAKRVPKLPSDYRWVAASSVRRRLHPRWESLLPQGKNVAEIGRTLLPELFGNR